FRSDRTRGRNASRPSISPGSASAMVEAVTPASARSRSTSPRVTPPTKPLWRSSRSCAPAFVKQFEPGSLIQNASQNPASQNRRSRTHQRRAHRCRLGVFERDRRLSRRPRRLPLSPQRYLGTGGKLAGVSPRQSPCPLCWRLYRPGVPGKRHAPVEDRRGGGRLRKPSLRRGLRIVVRPPVGGVDRHRLGLSLHPIRGSRSLAPARLDSASDPCYQR